MKKIQAWLWMIWREFLLLIWVMGAVLIVWMTAMYYKWIVFTVQDMLFDQEPVELVNIQDSWIDDYDFALEQVRSSSVEQIDTLLDEVDYRGIQMQKAITIQDYLDANLGDQEFAFNDLPPGRRLMIGSIEVDAPIVDVPYASDEKLQNGDFDQELREWVVKYPFTAEPGDQWNSLLFGHSSVTAREDAQNPFGYVFYKLQDLEPGETFDVIRDGQLYSYQIDDKSIKLPKDVWEEIEKYDQVGENFLTLMACFPRFTDAKRILVRAKQIENNPLYDSGMFADMGEETEEG